MLMEDLQNLSLNCHHILAISLVGPSTTSPPPNKQPYKIAGGSGPGTPNSRIHSIASLTPYQNR